MSDIIILALVALILALSILKLKKKGGTSCCSSGGYTLKRRKVADKNPRHYPLAKRLAVEGMTCENCARKAENALNGMNGVWASVSISSHSAKVLFKAPPDETAVREAVRQAGYVVTAFEVTS